MFGIGGFEFLLILLFAFLVFGPDKLPEIARTAGELIARFRQAKEEMDSVVRSELNGKDDAKSSSSQPSSRRRNVSAKPVPGSVSRAASDESKESGQGESGESASEGFSSRVVQAVDDAAASARESAHEQRVAASQATETFAERKARYERERQEANRQAMKDQASNAVVPESSLPSAAELYGNVPPAAKPRPVHASGAASSDSSKEVE